MTITCTMCDKTETFRTRSEETFGQKCAQAGWIVGLPNNGAWCPTCSRMAHVRTP